MGKVRVGLASRQEPGTRTLISGIWLRLTKQRAGGEFDARSALGMDMHGCAGLKYEG